MSASVSVLLPVKFDASDHSDLHVIILLFISMSTQTSHIEQQKKVNNMLLLTCADFH